MAVKAGSVVGSSFSDIAVTFESEAPNPKESLHGEFANLLLY